MRASFVGILGLLVLAACSGGGGGALGPIGSDPGSPAPGTDPGAPAPAEETEPQTVPKAVVSRLAAGLSIAEVAVFQGIKVQVAKNGAAATSKTPLVAGRDALVRVYVKPSADYDGRTVKALLRVLDADNQPIKVFQSSLEVSGASTDSNLESTFNFTVPGANLPPGAKMAVALTDPTAPETADGEANDARYPTDGTTAALAFKSAGPSLRIVIVPIKYQADGSGRLPDTSQTQLDISRDIMWGMYPVPEVEVTVRSQPFTWNTAIKGSGQGWGNLLQALVNLREDDGADDDVYYWGAFSAAPSFNAFCGQGCVLGLSTVVENPNNAAMRASIGVGYKGRESAETMAHELGHAHGRDHSPCSDFGQIDGVDPAFPHDGAELGAWGYDMVSKSLIAPTSNFDFMGYCTPSWVSDWTYGQLFTRLASVNKGKALTNLTPAGGGGSGAPGARAAKGGSFQWVNIEADGPASFGQRTTLRSAPVGDAREVELRDASGKTIRRVRGDFFRYDHLPGGMLLVHDEGLPYASVKVSGYGRVLPKQATLLK